MHHPTKHALAAHRSIVMSPGSAHRIASAPAALAGWLPARDLSLRVTLPKLIGPDLQHLLDRFASEDCDFDVQALIRVGAKGGSWGKRQPDTIGADELLWRGVLDPRDRALARRWWGTAMSLPARTGQ